MLTQRIGSVLPYGARQRLFALRRRIAQMRQEDWYIEDWAERAHLFRHVFEMLEFNGIDGDYAEFGYGSRTFSLAYWESRRAGLRPKLWGFDSFQGLPPQSANDGHVRWIAGTMKSEVAEAHRHARWLGLRGGDYELASGFFCDTLTSGREPRNIAFAYVDCDLFDSTLNVLRFLVARIKHGMVIAFDDYFCYSATHPSGERQACDQIFAELPQWRPVPYKQFGWHGMSFVVERQPGSIPKRDSA